MDAIINVLTTLNMPSGLGLLIGFAVVAPITEEWLKLFMIQKHHQYPDHGYDKLIVNVFLFEAMMYIMMYSPVVGVETMIIARIATFIMHYITMLLLYKWTNYKMMWIAVVIHSAWNIGGMMFGGRWLVS